MSSPDCTLPLPFVYIQDDCQIKLTEIKTILKQHVAKFATLIRKSWDLMMLLSTNDAPEHETDKTVDPGILHLVNTETQPQHSKPVTKRKSLKTQREASRVC
jgi:hypothetical protein